MSENKHLCLLGFTPAIEYKLKEFLIGSFPSFILQWVPANHAQLDGVVINAGFLETPQIKKFVTKVNRPIAFAYANEQGKRLAAERMLNALDLQAKTLTPPENWLGFLTGESPRVVTAQAAVEKSPERAPKPQADPVKKSQTPAQPMPAASAEPFPGAAAAMKSERNIVFRSGDQVALQRIRQAEAVTLCASVEGKQTWVKPAEGLVFINYAREAVPGYDQWQWQEVSAQDIPEAARQLKMDLWLFETLWQSHLDGLQYIDSSAFYRLKRWPQPLGRLGRTEALRLAACAQTHPVNIHTLREKTHYPNDKIHRFLFAATVAGQAEPIGNSGGQRVAPVVQENGIDEQQKAEKRSLLRRFREKLGL